MNSLAILLLLCLSLVQGWVLGPIGKPSGDWARSMSRSRTTRIGRDQKPNIIERRFMENDSDISLEAAALIKEQLQQQIFRSPSKATISHDKESILRGCTSFQGDKSCYQLHQTSNDDDAITTAFPQDLVGTFFQNGPGNYEMGGEQVSHQFDGDGLITGVTFHGGNKAPTFRSRFVETPDYIRDKEEGRMTRRGMFGTKKGDDGNWLSNMFDLRFKECPNTHVLFRDNRLFALSEAMLPFEIDPVTLETKTKVDKSLASGLDRVAAHYKIDPRNNRICSFSHEPNILPFAQTHKLHIMEHGDNMELQDHKMYELPGFGCYHDSAITEDFHVFVQPPVKFDPIPMILGTKGPAECISWDASQMSSQVHLLPRGSKHGDKAITVDVPPAFASHFVNAFQEINKDGETIVTIDVIASDKMVVFCGEGMDGAKSKQQKFGSPNQPEPFWERCDFVKDVPTGRVVRYRINVDQTRLEALDTLAKDVEFPVVNPSKVGQAYRYAYMNHRTSTDPTMVTHGLAKYDFDKATKTNDMVEPEQVWKPQPHEFLSEVSFCPRESATPFNNGEDYGYLVGYLMNGRDVTTDLVVFDSQNISQGPISRARLQHFLPHSLHGTFIPGYAPEVPRIHQEQTSEHQSKKNEPYSHASSPRRPTFEQQLQEGVTKSFNNFAKNFQRAFSHRH